MRPAWAETNTLMRDYYDTEWGVPVTTEQGVYERLCLEGFQAGLSWQTILVKRPAFREVFEDFNPVMVARFTDADVERLTHDARIIRHHGKIRAAIANARATLEVRTRAASGDQALQGFEIPRSGMSPLHIEPGLPALVWSFKPEATPRPRVLADIPTQDALSASLAKRLKAEGFKFIGPTSAYALMEAIGIIDTHLVDSHRRGVSGLYE